MPSNKTNQPNYRWVTAKPQADQHKALLKYITETLGKDPSTVDWNGAYEGTSWTDPTNYIKARNAAIRKTVNPRWDTSPKPLYDHLRTLGAGFGGKKAKEPTKPELSLGTIGGGIARHEIDSFKNSSNDYYTIGEQLAKKLGINTNDLYNPVAYDNPTLQSFYDTPTENKRNSGRYSYNADAIYKGGMDYADETAAYLLKTLGLDDTAFKNKYGTLSGISATENPLVQMLALQQADGTTKNAYWTPYDFAMHGLAGTYEGQDNYSFMPAQTADWWMQNANLLNVPQEFQFAYGENPYGLKTNTPNMGFLTWDNPLGGTSLDALKAELLAGRAGQGDYYNFDAQLVDGMMVDSDVVRQSYPDAGGFLGGGGFLSIPSLIKTGLSLAFPEASAFINGASFLSNFAGGGVDLPSQLYSGSGANGWNNPSPGSWTTTPGYLPTIQTPTGSNTGTSTANTQVPSGPYSMFNYNGNDYRVTGNNNNFTMFDTKGQQAYDSKTDVGMTGLEDAYKSYIGTL